MHFFFRGQIWLPLVHPLRLLPHKRTSQAPSRPPFHCAFRQPIRRLPTRHSKWRSIVDQPSMSFATQRPRRTQPRSTPRVSKAVCARQHQGIDAFDRPSPPHARSPRCFAHGINRDHILLHRLAHVASQIALAPVARRSHIDSMVTMSINTDVIHHAPS